MSIFQIQEWWVTTVGANEEFHNGSICIGNVDNVQPSSYKICTGSFEGKLRIFTPQPREYRMEDVLIDKDLQLPILQIACQEGLVAAGNKVLQPADNALVILHPRKLVVSAIISTNNFSAYKEIYAHEFKRNCYNFTIGAFGGKPTICVQSVDGALFFIRHDAQVFQVQLLNFLIPGVMMYLSGRDSLVISNSNLELECYNFASLQAATDNKVDAQKDITKEDQSTQKIIPEWICNLGEHPNHMIPHLNRYTRQTDIVVTGENTYFILNEKGEIRYQRRLDYTPSCVTTFHLQKGGADIFEDESRSKGQIMTEARENGTLETPCFMTVTGSYNNFLMVYRDVRLVWAARTVTAPIFISRTQFEDQDGLIVTMSDSGFLQVSFLGTEQLSSQNHAQTLKDTSQLNYETLSQEHTRILKQIKQFEDEKQVEPTDSIQLSCQLQPVLEESNEYVEDPKNQIAVSAQSGKVLRAKLKITLSYQPGANPLSPNFTQVQLNIECGKQTAWCENPVFNFDSISFEHSMTPNVVQTFIYPLSKMLHAAPINVSLTYQQIKDSQKLTGTLRSASQVLKLPFAFQVQLNPEVEKGNEKYKVQLTLDKAAPGLPTLFPEITRSLKDEDLKNSRRQLTFRSHNGELISMLTSKDELKIRLQSNTIAAIWPVLNETCKQLQLPSQGAYKISYTDRIPLKELDIAIDAHFDCRMELKKLRKMLDDSTLQFRMIQKRLLNRFKDKNPSPLNNLDFLLTHTYGQIIETTNAVDNQRLKLADAASSLSNMVETCNLLTAIGATQQLSEEQYNLLRQFITGHVDDGNLLSEMGWEEICYASTAHLLRTCLSRKQQNQPATSQTIMDPLDTTERLKKQISAVIDRVKNGSLIEL